MARSGFGGVVAWAAKLLSPRDKSEPSTGGEPALTEDDASASHTSDELERVRTLSRQVAGQTDDAIRLESPRLGALVTEILRAAGGHIVPETTTQRLADVLVAECRQRGVAPAMLGYRDFPSAAAISVNDEIVHGIPSSRRIQAGDLVKVELGVVSGIAFAAQSWTFAVGAAEREDAPLLAAGREALTKAVSAVAPRARLGDVGDAIQSTTEAVGLSVVRAFVGYGMGKERIQGPQIPVSGRRVGACACARA